MQIMQIAVESRIGIPKKNFSFADAAAEVRPFDSPIACGGPFARRLLCRIS